MLDNSRPNFEAAQNAATNLLLQQNLNSLHIDVRKFRFDRDIVIDSIQNYAVVTGRPLSDFTCDQFSGCCVVKHPRAQLILFDDSVSDDRRKHWGIVHEVGHVYLNHDKDEKKEEIEAHFFAAQLIAPEIVLWDIVKRTGSLCGVDVYLSFNISFQAAEKRIQTMRSRGMYNTNSIDKALLEKFRPLLDKRFSPLPEQYSPAI